MINPKKVKVMTRNALYESSKGRESLKIKKYCEDMPVWKSMTRSAVAGVFLYLLVFFVVAAADFEGMAAAYERIGNVWTIVIIAGGMAACAAGYSVISDTIFHKKYKKIRSELSTYKSDKKYLNKIRERQELNENAG